MARFGLGHGEGAGQLFDPIGLTVDVAGRAWVADWLRGHGRVHGFAPDGTHLGTWSVGDDGQRPGRPKGWQWMSRDGSTWPITTCRGS
jgi:hypothetical protein